MTFRDHPQDITYWSTTLDGFNSYVFAAPVVIKGRWENKKIMIRNNKGDDAFSKAIVYVDTDVKLGDYIAEGDQTATPDPTTLSDAHEVKQFDKTPSLRQFDYERKALL